MLRMRRHRHQEVVKFNSLLMVDANKTAIFSSHCYSQTGDRMVSLTQIGAVQL